MISEEEVRQYTRECIHKQYYDTASAIVLKSNYIMVTGWRFDKMRAVVDSEIQIYKQRLNS